MNITDVKVTKIENVKSLKALANITFDKCFVVGGLKIMEGKNGLFVSMPSKKNKDETYSDVCFPVTKEFRQEIIDAVMMKYEDGENKSKKTFEGEAVEDDDNSDDFPF